MRAWLALLPLLAACGERAGPIHPAADTEGRPSIVSLNPCADAILAEIAAPGQVLAISHYSHDPAASSMPQAEAARFVSTGGTAEEVLALSPDMVVADSFIASATRRALERAGIAVKTIGIASSLDDSLQQVEMLGDVTGNVAAARKLSGRIAAAWHDHAHDGDSATAILWQEGGIVAGEGSLVFAMMERAGLASLTAARGLGQGAYLPLEHVLADPPRIAITAGDDRAFSHPALSAASSVTHFNLNPGLLYCGGPTVPPALQRFGQIREQAG